jgi:predicted small secreted protein
MRQNRAALIIAAFATLSGTVAACASRNTVQTGEGEVALDGSASVVVNNQGVNDMTIYVLEGGSVRRRLGIAGAARETQLSIPRALVGNGRELQFLADPIARRGNSVSQRIFVEPGDRVGLTILP